MKAFEAHGPDSIGMTVREFEVLEDVLSEIQESREYYGDDLAALESLKAYFSYSNFRTFRDAKL